MDRCRCADYASAVKNIRFYTPGTMNPLYLDKCSRDGFRINWVKNAMSHKDFQVRKVKACLLEDRQAPSSQLSANAQKKEQMWCRYMTGFKQRKPEESVIIPRKEIGAKLIKKDKI